MEIQLCVSPESVGSSRLHLKALPILGPPSWKILSWTEKTLQPLGLPHPIVRGLTGRKARGPQVVKGNKLCRLFFFFFSTQNFKKKKSLPLAVYFLLLLRDLWPSYPLTLSIVNTYKNKSTPSACDNLHCKDIHYVPPKHFFFSRWSILSILHFTVLHLFIIKTTSLWGRMDTCIYMAESLHCSPETITSLLISYVLCLVAQLCLTLCNRMDCTPPGSSVYGDSPGKKNGVGCHASSRGSSQPWDRTQVSCILGDSLPSETLGKSNKTVVGSLSLLQGNFPTQE